MPKSVTIDQTPYIFTAITVTPKVDFDGIQKTDFTTKVPQWSVECLLEEPGDVRSKAEVIKVTITAPNAPVLPKLTELEFGRLQVLPWNMAQKDRDTKEMTGINSGLAFSADNVRVKSNTTKTNGTKAEPAAV